MRKIFYLASILLYSCQAPKLISYDFPKPVNTSDHRITLQEKRSYHIGELIIDNQFDGARVSDFYLDTSGYHLLIEPENHPINPSPWYAFRIQSATLDTATILLEYHYAKHRYPPKWSEDGKSWQLLDSTLIMAINDSVIRLTLPLIPNKKTWIAAQEIENSTSVKSWCETIAGSPDVSFHTFGKSKLGRDLFVLDMGTGSPENKPIIVLMSRQHPPEVTGFLAMKSFVESLLDDNALASDFLHKYRILVFPLMNPDGVDLGHWRHNAGGIDLNRDWAYFRQPETRQMAKYVIEVAHKNKAEVYLGIDFHSTYDDRYYTFESQLKSSIYRFKDYWLMGIKDRITNYHPKDIPGGLQQPISKNWFYLQFNAEAITYEIGDNTPRDFIKEKSNVAAKEMMKLLIFK